MPAHYTRRNLVQLAVRGPLSAIRFPVPAIRHPLGCPVLPLSSKTICPRRIVVARARAATCPRTASRDADDRASRVDDELRVRIEDDEVGVAARPRSRPSTAPDRRAAPGRATSIGEPFDRHAARAGAGPHAGSAELQRRDAAPRRARSRRRRALQRRRRRRMIAWRRDRSRRARARSRALAFVRARGSAART